MRGQVWPERNLQAAVIVHDIRYGLRYMGYVGTQDNLVRR